MNTSTQIHTVFSWRTMKLVRYSTPYNKMLQLKGELSDLNVNGRSRSSTDKLREFCPHTCLHVTVAVGNPSPLPILIHAPG